MAYGREKLIMNFTVWTKWILLSCIKLVPVRASFYGTIKWFLHWLQDGTSGARANLYNLYN